MDIDMVNLAIKGHSTRGKEVINLLEMLGANSLGYKDTFVGFYYYIECGAICSSDEYPTYATIFTLEEFLEKYPYKVGDKVTLDNKLCSIIWMCWECNNIYYQVQGIGDVFTKKVTADELNLYKEETMEKEEENFAECIEKTIQECLFGKEGATKEIKIDIPKGYEFFGIDDNNKVVLTKIQPQYPTTYVESCSILGFNKNYDLNNITTHDVVYDYKLQMLYRILICRDAYWKIAGEEMGLGQPWKPDRSTKPKYTIVVIENKLVKHYALTQNYILTFPTAEMRDAFYANFKDLIEQCKELL